MALFLLCILCISVSKSFSLLKIANHQEIQPINFKGINPEYSLEGLMPKLKLQYFGHLMQRADSLEKALMLGKIDGEEKGRTEDEMVDWHHGLNRV